MIKGGRYLYEDVDRVECLELVPQQARRVLDVGCGFGGFGSALKRTRPDMEVWGIEQHPAAVAVARDRLNQVIEGLFLECIPTDRFDAVTFLDVLEHMEDPWAALERTRSVLGADGVVVASIPNIRNYTVTWPLVMRGRWNYEDAGILDRTHLRFFTKHTIVEMFANAGFEVVSTTPLAMSPPPPWRTRTGLLMRALSASMREEFLAIQYGIVARPI